MPDLDKFSVAFDKAVRFLEIVYYEMEDPFDHPLTGELIPFADKLRDQLAEYGFDGELPDEWWLELPPCRDDDEQFRYDDGDFETLLSVHLSWLELTLDYSSHIDERTEYMFGQFLLQASDHAKHLRLQRIDY